MNGLFAIVTFVAALGSGLAAGLFFIFSVCIMRALERLPAPQGIAAMQEINVTILNPWFFTAFFGTAVLSLAAIVLALLDWEVAGSAWALAGGAVYLVAAIGVTMVFNVPLNNALVAAAPDSGEAARLWARYLSVWTAWNHLRTVGSLLAMACFIQALR